jgi:hypothetical protein
MICVKENKVHHILGVLFGRLLFIMYERKIKSKLSKHNNNIGKKS